MKGGIASIRVQTTVLHEIEFASYDGERWFIKDIEERKKIGIFGTYTLEEWESILPAVSTEKKEACKQ